MFLDKFLFLNKINSSLIISGHIINNAVQEIKKVIEINRKLS